MASPVATTAPMMCALLLRTRATNHVSRRVGLFDRVLAGYERSLDWALRHSRLVLSVFFAAIALNAVLFYVLPKGLFPQQDTGRMYVWLGADQNTSFEAMAAKLRQIMAIVQQDPAVQNVVGFTGANSGFGGSSNTGAIIVSLKPLSQRPSVDEVIAGLRPFRQWQ